ncbi:cytochrome-c peroxidase [Aquimarina litoralis]|uniref:cytochrome-c peroxidase n=1 Tax=Aquimarina litoralis TaxID=584605 RepID=UPI0031D806DA
MKVTNLLLLLCICIFVACSNEESNYVEIDEDQNNEEVSETLQATFGQNIDLNNLANYAAQNIPNYITRDNTNGNAITDEKATLGRILFYDKNLSSDNTISCSSCHQQAFAFSDGSDVSTGVNGTTGRHSMRLVNARFSDEVRFFWDERASTLEEQTTQPIQDHAEMGFSGENGDPSITDLLSKLEQLSYYQELFQFAYGNTTITEERLQECLAQFIRSIQSFDSKYDDGRAVVVNNNMDFPNFTDQENLGKTIFMQPPNEGGAGCITCHQAPEFSIDPESLNNGVTGVFGVVNDADFTITRSPSLRDIMNANGTMNGALMHDASIPTIMDAILHYNDIDATGNTNLDNRLRGGAGGNGQNLNLTNEEMLALEAFLKTLSGSNMYTDTKWSDPFL